MKLTLIDYSQDEGESLEWNLEGLSLGEVALLVGKNASGKSRTINVIHALSRLLSGPNKLNLRSGTWNTRFEEGGKSLCYNISCRDSKVVSETFTIDGQELLSRGSGGKGQIFYEKLDRTLEFQTPEDEFAAVNRRDNIQHSFLEPLYDWANSVRYYPFGTPLGKDFLAIFAKGGQEVDTSDWKQVVGVFRRGQDEFGDSFKCSVIHDMCAIGYELTEIQVASPVSVTFQGPVAGDLVVLAVKEASLSGPTDQFDMSQGMFRALSILIQINYSAMAGGANCILIDDIGEGLDFQRSCDLIELLIEKTSKHHVQIIMSSNDRFVMNKVPLEAWTLLQREDAHHRVRVYNYANSKAVFDEFKFTGLNNFDFFAKDFVHEDLEDEDNGGDEETRDFC